MDKQLIKELERKVDELISVNNKLSSKNHMLEQKKSGLQTEKATLMQKNDIARAKIESMIGRLKMLEQE